MKKVMMIAALAAALVSCQSKGTQNNDTVAMADACGCLPDCGG